MWSQGIWVSLTIWIYRIFAYGPKYRETPPIDWAQAEEEILKDLEPLVNRWAGKAALQDSLWLDWKKRISLLISRHILSLKGTLVHQPLPGLQHPRVKRSLQELHRHYVVVPADKAANNVIIVCKHFYLSSIVKELLNNSDKTFEHISTLSTTIIQSLITQLKNNFCLETPEAYELLSSLYWSAKMHKDPPAARFITASHRCVLKELSTLLTRVLKTLIGPLKGLCASFRNSTNVSPWWVIDNSTAVLKCIKVMNERGQAKTVHSFDFKTLYTKIPHESIKKELKWVVKQAFQVAARSEKPFLKVSSKTVAFRKTKGGSSRNLSQDKVVSMIEFLIDNLYIEVGDRVFRQCVGIPMGTDCAPFLANLYLFALEYKYLDGLHKKKDHKKLLEFRHCFRYIDDLLTINNSIASDFDFSCIYPSELILERTNRTDYRTEFLDLSIVVNDRKFILSIYDKTDDFDFSVVKYPHLSGNTHFKRSHGLISGILLRLTVCSHFEQFAQRAKEATSRLIERGFSKKLLKSAAQKFFSTYDHITRKYSRNKQTFVDSCFA